MKKQSWIKVFLVLTITALFIASPALSVLGRDDFGSSSDSLSLEAEERGTRGPLSHKFILKSDAKTKIFLTPEYSDQTKFSLHAGVATIFDSNFGVGLLGTLGEDKNEIMMNVGWQFADNHRLVVTGSKLQQNLKFDFISGEDKAEITQHSGAFSYQYLVGNSILNSMELNAYLADTGSENLTDKTYAIDTATVYELWKDPRRIAGGKVKGLQSKITITPFSTTTLKLGAGMEELEYNYLTGAVKSSKSTSDIALTQELPGSFILDAWFATTAAMDTYDLGLVKNFSGHQLGVSYTKIQGRDGLSDDNKYTFSYRYNLTSSSSRQVKTWKIKKSTWSSSILNQVSKRPIFIPAQVVAKIDVTAEQDRLIAIDKTAIPAGATIDSESGNIKVSLGGVVTSIAWVTLDGGPFNNSGQFSLANNNLVVHPDLISEPIAGDTDLYEVTVNNSGGGTTLVSVTVSHGSVQIDSIIVFSDTTPNSYTFTDQTDVALSTVITSDSITVAGINTASAINITGGEYEINESGTWTSSAGTVNNGDTVRVRHTSSSSNSTAVDSVLTIGGVSDTFTSTTIVNAPQVSPTLETPISNQTVNEETAFSLDVSWNFNDSDGDSLTYSATWLPSGLSINENTGVISGTLPNVWSNTTETVTITAEDPDGESVSDSFDITINNVDTIAPSKTGENFANLDTQWASFSGTMTFDEAVANVSSISFISWWTVSVTGWLGTNILTIEWTAPNVDNTKLTVTIEDEAWNSRNVESNIYSLDEIPVFSTSEVTWIHNVSSITKVSETEYDLLFDDPNNWDTKIDVTFKWNNWDDVVPVTLQTTWDDMSEWGGWTSTDVTSTTYPDQTITINYNHDWT